MPVKISLLRRFLLFLTLEACASLVFLLALPAEGGRISAARLALVLALTAAAALPALLWLRLRSTAAAQALASWLDVILRRPALYAVLLLAALLVALICVYTVWFFVITTNTQYQGVLLRLMPMILLAGTASLEGALFSRQFLSLPTQRLPSLSVAILPGVLFLAQAGLGAFVFFSRIGLTRDNGVGLGWGDPGTPLLAEQVALVVFICLAAAFLMSVLTKWRGVPSWLDAALFLIIWGLAAFLWLNQPLRSNYFAPPPRAPNYEYYPYSDAGNYDQAAQSLLTGSRLGGVVKRPFYSLFLAGLHALSGGQFSQAVSLQVFVLAVFPAFLYLLGRRSGSRFTGLLLAGLAILREINALNLSGEINVSHVRLMMSDVPTALGIVLLALAGGAWLHRPESRSRALACGGILGLLMLVRSQTVLLAFPVLLLAGLQKPRRAGLWARRAAFFLLGIGLALLPWLGRNFALTGTLAFEERGQLSALTQRYSADPTSAGAEDSGGLAYLLADPGNVLSFAAEHFLHNWVSARFILPVDFRLAGTIDEYLGKYPYWKAGGEPAEKLYATCCSLLPYVREDVPYWQAWDGTVPSQAVLLLLFGFAISALGAASAWRRAGWAGLLPGAFFLAYAASCALIRSSGWRYIQPADWAVLFYYALGIGAVIHCGLRFFGLAAPDDRAPEHGDLANAAPPAERMWLPLLSGALILLAGSGIPLAEALISPRYPPKSELTALSALPAEVRRSAGLPAAPELYASQEQGDFLVYGRALYPKIFAAGEDDPWYTNWKGRRARLQNELDFLIIGSRGALPVVLPLGERTQTALPHFADVLILGRRENGVLTARTVVVLDEANAQLIQSSQIPGGD